MSELEVFCVGCGLRKHGLDAFDGRYKLDDERFGRDMGRIKALEASMETVTKLAIEMADLHKQNDEALKKHEKRLEILGANIL